MYQHLHMANEQLKKNFAVDMEKINNLTDI